MSRAVTLLAAALCVAACHQPRFHIDRPVYGMLWKSPPLGPEENIRVTQIEAGESSSVALIQVRDREQPHVHARYDLTVYVAAGEGTLWLKGKPQPMQAGDAAFIPKGTPHYFVNQGAEPAAAIVVFSPPFSGPDQKPAP